MWLLDTSGLKQHWNKSLSPSYSYWWAAMVKCEDKRQSYELNTKRALGLHQHGVEGTGWVEALGLEHQDAALVEDWAVPWQSPFTPWNPSRPSVLLAQAQCRREHCCWRAGLAQNLPITKERMTLGELHERDVLSRSRTDASLTRQFPRQCWNHTSLSTAALSNTFSTS